MENSAKNGLEFESAHSFFHFVGLKSLGDFLNKERRKFFKQGAVFAIGSRIVFGYLFMNLLKRKSELFLDIYL